MGQRYRTMEDQKPWLGFAQEGFGKGKWLKPIGKKRKCLTLERRVSKLA